jgi:hypothetical protein
VRVAAHDHVRIEVQEHVRGLLRGGWIHYRFPERIRFTRGFYNSLPKSQKGSPSATFLAALSI